MSRPEQDMNNTPDTERFDQAMRALHAQALERTSPATRLRLRSARAASTDTQRTHRGLRWTSAAVATVFALAIGFNLDPSTRQPTPITPPPSAIATASDDGSHYESAVTALDENPDLYVWLASNDDAWLASQ